MLFFKIMQPNSFFGFGYPQRRGSYKSWILQSRDAHGIRELFGANRWMHICLAYEKSTGTVRVIRVTNFGSCSTIFRHTHFKSHITFF